jgi:signal-transduction protein with cAMP-binding, CBS, and nucleotidyltransferase domain
MKLTEKLFALQQTAPFDQLREPELALIADIAWERHYEPGDTVLSKEQGVKCLYIVINGSVLYTDHYQVGPILGAASLLFGVPIREALWAGESGASCLLIFKRHFFTIVNECPNLVVGLLQIPWHESKKTDGQ